MNGASEEKRLSRKEREFLARKAEIMAAATKVFAHKGYHGATMSEIAKEAEFSIGSLYNFFKNKEALYFSLLEEKISSLEAEVQRIMEKEDSFENKLRAFVSVILSFFSRERDFFRILVDHRSQFELSSKGKFSDVVHEKYENYLNNMVKLMEEGKAQGVFKDIDPSVLALSLLGILNTIIFIFVNSPSAPFSLEDQAELVLDIFFNGTRRAGGDLGVKNESET